MSGEPVLQRVLDHMSDAQLRRLRTELRTERRDLQRRTDDIHNALAAIDQRLVPNETDSASVSAGGPQTHPQP